MARRWSWSADALAAMVGDAVPAPPPPGAAALKRHKQEKRATRMAQTQTKVHVFEKEVVLAHMAAVLGRAPWVYSPPPTGAQEVLRCFGLLAHHGAADRQALSAARAAFDGHAFDEEDNFHVFTMDDVGKSLYLCWQDGAYRQRFRAVARRARLVVEMMRALWVLHEGGIEHGDLHIKNICLRDVAAADDMPVATVIDFGKSDFVARTPERADRTLAFLPELVVERSKFLDVLLAKLDIRSLGKQLNFTVIRDRSEWPVRLESALEDIAARERATRERQRQRAAAAAAAVVVEKSCVLCAATDSVKWWHGDKLCNGCFHRTGRYNDDAAKLEAAFGAERTARYLELVRVSSANRRKRSAAAAPATPPPTQKKKARPAMVVTATTTTTTTFVVSPVKRL